jgi:hypothetical protein
MAKTTDARFREILQTAQGVNPAIENYFRFCLEDGRFSELARNNKGLSYSQYDCTLTKDTLLAGVSLGETKLGAGEKRKRNLRRTIMLLHGFVNCIQATGLNSTTVAVPIKPLSENALIQYLQEAWGKLAVYDAFEWLEKNTDGMQPQMLRQMYAARAPQQQLTLQQQCQTGLLQGPDAREFFLGQFRCAILLLELLSQPNANSLAALQGTVAGAGYGTLQQMLQARRIAVTNARMAHVDNLPHNTQAQVELLAMRNTGLPFFQRISVHTEDGSIVDNGEDFSVITVPNNERVQTLGFVQRSENEIGALDLVRLESTTRGIPIYFLPWKPNFITKMAIPAGGPSIFFTAAINGCSVFVTGTPQAPTVYHGGIGTDLETCSYSGNAPGVLTAKQNGNAPVFWRRLLMHLETLQDTDILGEAQRNQYVKDKATPTMGILAPTIFTTQHARQFEQNQNATVPGGTLLMCSAWGCVFGLRDVNGNWAFYLQENVAVTYMQAPSNVFRTCRPVFLSKIFPVPNRNAPQTVYDGTNQPIPNLFTPSLTVR